jgi:hypothetical protein
LLREGLLAASRQMLVKAWPFGAPIGGCTLFPVDSQMLPAFLAAPASRALLVLASLTREECSELVREGLMQSDFHSNYEIGKPETVSLALRRLYPDLTGPSTPATDQIRGLLHRLLKAGPFAHVPKEKRVEMESLVNELILRLRTLESRSPSEEADEADISP